MTSPKEFAEAMRNIPEVLNKRGHQWDQEDSHIVADSYMCELLRELGYGEGVDVFENMSKWYS